jgi:hypothetical protein
MAAEVLSIPEESLAQVIEIIRAGCDHFEDVADFEETVERLREWCDAEEEYLSDQD